MRTLNEQEIMALVETMEPEDILRTRADDLDEKGKAFLQELGEDIRMGEEAFAQYGREFRGDEESLPIPMPQPSKDIPEKKKTRGTIRLPIWALAGAAALLIASVLLIDLYLTPDYSVVRGNNVDLRELKELNQELVEVLIKRGEFLKQLGREKNESKYYHHALIDIRQAYELDPKNTDVLSLLARLYEDVGDDKKAAKYFEEYMAARAEEDKTEADDL